MDQNEKLEAAYALRREVLGDAYVDSVVDDPDPAARDFQDHLTVQAWGAWQRGGAALGPRPQPVGAGHDRRARPHGGVPPARRGHAPHRGHRRRARRAALPDRRLLRRPRRGRRPGARSGRSRRAGRRGVSVPAVGDGVVGHGRAGQHGRRTRDEPRRRRARAGGPRRGRSRTGACRLDHGDRRRGGGPPGRGGGAQPARRRRRRGRWSTSRCATADRRTSLVVDTSTVGVAAARELAAARWTQSASATSTPRSREGWPGPAPARCTVMYAGTDAACAAAEPVLAGLSDRRRAGGGAAGDGPGREAGQQLPLGRRAGGGERGDRVRHLGGVDMATVLEVRQRLQRPERGHAATSSRTTSSPAGTRRASATRSWPRTSRSTWREAGHRSPADGLGAQVAECGRRSPRAEPGADFTRIFPFVAGD